MKKLFLTLLFAVMALTASAQFEQGKYYLSSSLTGFNLQYSKDQNVTLGLDAMGGHFFTDSWMGYARFGYGHQFMKHGSDFDNVKLGAGARYYIEQNGLYIGAGLQYEHRSPNFNYVQIPIEVGYCFFLNQHVTIEPALYYDLCLNKFSDGSSVGLKIGLGFFF